MNCPSRNRATRRLPHHVPRSYQPRSTWTTVALSSPSILPATAIQPSTQRARPRFNRCLRNTRAMDANSRLSPCAGTPTRQRVLSGRTVVTCAATVRGAKKVTTASREQIRRPRATAQANLAYSATGTVTVPSVTSYVDPGGHYSPSASVPNYGSNGWLAGLAGGSHSNSFLVFANRGGSSEHVICGPFSGSDPVITPSAASQGTTCVVADHPGNQISLSLVVNFYAYNPTTRTTQLAPSPLPQIDRRNVGHLDANTWRIFFFSNEGFVGVDSVSGVCSVHGAIGNLGTRTATGTYTPSCGD
jgi:hypothetical protein